MLHSYHQNAGKSYYIKVPNELFKKMHISDICGISNKLKLHLRKDLKQIHCREFLKPLSEIALSSCLISENVKVKIFLTVILPV
jgi:RNase P subunit RPR2